jgi:hypothetical protein
MALKSALAQSKKWLLQHRASGLFGPTAKMPNC